MPSPKRWFPVSRDINRDHETWEFTDRFGDRALRTWLEILAQLDAHENRIVVTDAWYAGLSRLVRQTSANLRRQVDGLVAVGWLSVRQPTTEEPWAILSARKYADYHRTKEIKGRKGVSHPNRTEPNRTEPNRRERKEKERTESRGDGSPNRPPPAPADGEFFESLKKRPAYQGIDFDREIDRCRVWCEENRQLFSRKRIISWLNRARPLQEPREPSDAEKRKFLDGA